ncbi:protein phosphatase PrpC [Paraliobacillus ryukyuensis]|uniref:protein-serine/threonine phosphatase n=1 Tax=Paraliobacillus ryukyuensis TaxID=200904 RepID=A0A366EK86_9BACI|nr:Stp1/IreP family PP2C-type Ser/Thr phosphatase [Paraliobacillus ryukyuensis]RBP01845.1 protein phosphatase [Paraliobacillus ryukyuensis]
MHYYLTNIGKVRMHNEDAGGIFQNEALQYLTVVADGMGGHKAGDVASQLVVEWMENEWKSTKESLDRQGAATWLTEVITKANQYVYQKSIDNEALLGMGTTVVAVIYGEDFISVANIGDSRCYLLHNGTISQITEDHSLVNELVRSGQISKEDADFHPRKNVLTKALGTEAILQPDIFEASWKQDDQLLLCTDGLTNKLSDEELSRFLTDDKSNQEKAEMLIDTANERGGEDNITLVISSYETNKAGDTSC